MIMSTMLASVAEGMCLSDSLGLNNEALVEVGGYCYCSATLVSFSVGDGILSIRVFVVADTLEAHRLSVCHQLSLRRRADSCVPTRIL